MSGRIVGRCRGGDEHSLDSRTPITFRNCRGKVMLAGRLIANDGATYCATAKCNTCAKELIIYNGGFPKLVKWNKAWHELRGRFELEDQYIIMEEYFPCP